MREIHERDQRRVVGRVEGDREARGHLEVAAIGRGVHEPEARRHVGGVGRQHRVPGRVGVTIAAGVGVFGLAAQARQALRCGLGSGGHGSVSRHAVRVSRRFAGGTPPASDSPGGGTMGGRMGAAAGAWSGA